MPQVSLKQYDQSELLSPVKNNKILFSQDEIQWLLIETLHQLIKDCFDSVKHYD